MKKTLGVMSLAASIIFLLSCGPTATVTTRPGPTISEVQQTSSFAKMRIAVSRFENKTTYYISEGMTDMLVSALFETGKFLVLERENLDVVLQEQKLSTVGVIDKKTAIPAGMLEGAEFLVVGAITGFEPDYKGAQTVVGGAKQSYVSMDMRIIDSKTARVVSSVTVEGNATDKVLNPGALKWVSSAPLISSLSAWSNTPIDKAIRLCIDKAVDFVVNYSLERGGKK
jgi:curli biogenesis system outer membrane secretion channel CsgG